MNRPRPAPRVLVVSPIASHPADQGNAARIQATGRELMARGVVCEFLHYATEGCAPEQEAAMSAFWRGGFHLVPPQPVARAGMAGAWALDDWCPASLADRVSRLHRGGRHDAVLVHYVWMSRALEGVGGGALRVLDTHDLFGDRHLVAREQGLDPSWFFTTREEEARGLARADLVLAIQEAEAAALRERSAAPVLTLGHMPPLRFLGGAPPRPRRRRVPPSAISAAPTPGTSRPCARWTRPWRRRPTSLGCWRGRSRAATSASAHARSCSARCATRRTSTAPWSAC